VIGLVMSIEFVRKYKFKKLERSIYVRNINNTFNYEGQIEYTAKVRLFYKRYGNQCNGGQKWSVILEML